MVVQLDLFSGVDLNTPIEVMSHKEYSEMIVRNDLYGVVSANRFCGGCPYSGLCDVDDCAWHTFKLDSKAEPRMSFTRWSEI